MKKGKSTLLLLLLAALLVLGACLPGLVSLFQNRAVTGTVFYEEIQPVSLNIQELTILDRLKMLNEGSSVELSKTQTKKSQEEIRTLTDKALEPYLEMLGLSWDLSDFTFMATPILCYRYNPYGSVSNPCWRILYFYETETITITTISLTIDEETGSPLLLDFTDPSGLLNPDAMESDLLAFIRLYFEGLGLDAEDAMAHLEREDEFAAASAEEAYSDDTAKAGRSIAYSWRAGDAIAGEVTLHFYAFDSKIYVHFY